MKKYNILVTGVGAIIGYGIVRSLRQCRYDVNITGMDVYPDAVGHRWCDAFLQSIWAYDAEYCDFLADVVDKLNIDLVFFGTEPEIHRLCDDEKNYKGDFCKLILNNKNLISLSRDKWLLHQYLKMNQFNTIKSAITGEYELIAETLGIPCLVKPRCSTASKGISIIQSREDFYYWKQKLGKNFMVQEIVGDDYHEYTVGAFGMGDSSLASSITFERKLSREGSTIKARTVNIPELDQKIQRLAALLKPIGPTNFQFRQHKKDYLLLEVNPRFSSSLSLRTSFGFNEPEMCIQYFGEKIRPEPVIIKQGTAIRYFEDIVTLI